MKKGFKKSYLFLFIVLIILAGCGDASPAANTGASSGSTGTSGAAGGNSTDDGANEVPAELVEMTIATVGQSVQSGPIYYAMENNLWEKYGLKVKMVNLDPAASVAALISGSAHIIHAGPNIVDAAIKTDKVKVIGTYGELPMWLYSKEITSLADLKGKTIGSTTPGGAVDYVTKTMIRSAGLEVGKDVEILYAGNGAAVLATLSEGKVDAGLLLPPNNFQGDNLGLKNITYANDIAEVKGKYGVMGVHHPFAEKYPEAVESYMKGFVEASKLLRTDVEGAKAAIGKHTNLTGDKVLDQSYDIYVENDLWPTDLHIPESEIEFLLEELVVTNPAASSTKPADVMENRYADAVE
ncbi:ABC transporter substrate-binding protein [Paenibacillus abyssi]|uniref:SsuA/THI5-like domain-containing protein n=1 Tax=Paenibacillus abyssi TaxID=1340531 RepID=A0A917FNQ6_9BACL|nr:ABC transporter substrate-binding protein [Paenibacillus abyssi]GGF93409.1 hypothetical protein GCM10010916_08480 [Paenibacillus abyssi]